MEIPQELIVAGYVALGGAIAWLAHEQAASKRRCEREGVECRAKQAALDDFIRERLLGIASESAADRTTTLAELTRARRVIERAEHRHPTTGDETPLVPNRSHV